MNHTAVFDASTYQKGLAQFTAFITYLTQFDNKHPAPVFTTKGLSESDSDLVTSTKFWRIDQIEEAFKDGWKLNENGYCVSVAVNEFGIDGIKCKLSISNVSRVRAHCIDVDVPLPIDVLREIVALVNPQIVNFSSSYQYEEQLFLKAHLYFIYGPTTKPEQEKTILDNYNILQAAISYRIDAVCKTLLKDHPALPYLKETFLSRTKGHFTDKNITLNKIMRAPGFWHQKNPTNATFIKCNINHSCPSTSLSETYKTLVEQFKLTPEWFEKVKTLKESDKKKHPTPMAPNGKKGSAVYEETADGGRNNEMLSYIWKLVAAKNKSREEVTDITYGANLRKNKPPLSEERLDMMIEGAYQKLGDGYAGRSNMLVAPVADRHDWKENIKKEADKAIRKYNYTKKIHQNTLSDPAILSRVYDRYGDIIKGNYALGHFSYNEENGIWEHTSSKATTRVREVIQDMRHELYVQAHFPSSDKEEYDCVKMDAYLAAKLSIGTTKALTNSIVTDEEFQLDISLINKTSWLLNAPNCIIDLTTGAALEHAPDEYMTGAIAVPYLGEDAVVPFLNLKRTEDWNKGINLHSSELTANTAVYFPGLWQQFIYDIMEGDIEMCRFLQRVFGYAMFGHNKEQKAFFCIGNGDNGKSLCLETIQKLFGNYTGKNLPSEMLLNKTDKGSSYASSTLANLLYWRYALTGEVDNNKKWNETFFKDITTNGSITARRMKEDSITFTPRFTLFVQGNKKPEFDGNDDAIWKRVCLIPFNHKVKPEHKNIYLENILCSPEGLTEILHWTVAGAMYYAKHGLELPQTVVAAVKGYKAEMLPFDEFFAEAIERLAERTTDEEIVKHQITSKRVADAYLYWCKVNDREDTNISPSSIGVALSSLIKKPPIKTGSARYFAAKFTDAWEHILKSDDYRRAPVTFTGPRNQMMSLMQGVGSFKR